MNEVVKIRRTEPYTVEELTGMSDQDFRNAVTDDMHAVGGYNGPFQDFRVVERTLDALIDSLWRTNQKIDDRQGDPNCSAELYARTVRYRAHLLSVIDRTERRVGWLKGTKERDLRKWKQTLHSVIEAILEGKDDEEILALEIPSFRGEGGTYDLETWFDIRLQKDPSRVKPWMEEAA